MVAERYVYGSEGVKIVCRLEDVVKRGDGNRSRAFTINL